MENSKEQIVAALEKLADKLGVKAELIFGFYLKQAKLYKYRYFINVFISLVLVCVSSAVFYYCKDMFKTADALLNTFFIVSAIFWVVTIIIFLVNTLSLNDLFTSIKNPEYMAMSEILSNLQGD